MIDKIEIIKNKIIKINNSKKYKYILEFEHIKNKELILHYGINYKTSSGYILKTIGFSTIEELYCYILGIMDILEIF